MDWVNMVGQPAAETVPSPEPGFSTMLQPLGPVAAETLTSPTSQEDFEQRKAGWQAVMEKLNDPNVRRALLYAGTYLAQPIPYGQNALGHLASAVNFGYTAYDMGRRAELEEEKLAETTKQIKAQTESTKVQTEGTLLENEKKQRTMEAIVQRLKTLANQADFDLRKAKDQEEVDKIVRMYDIKKAKIMAAIDDDAIALSVFDQLEKQGVENRLKNAHAEMYKASARHHDTAASVLADDNKVDKKREVDELKDAIAPFFTAIVANGINAIKKANPKLSDAEAAGAFWLQNKLADLIQLAEMEWRASKVKGKVPQKATDEKRVMSLQEAEELLAKRRGVQPTLSEELDSIKPELSFE